MTYDWRVNQTASPSSDELQEALNALESNGYEVYSIFVVGHSVMVVARKPVLEMSEADRSPTRRT